MGIGISGLRALSLGLRTGLLDLERTLMLGRQEIAFGEPDYEAVAAASRLPARYQDAFRPPNFAEPLLHALGAGSVESIDGSAYEGATHIHDFNQPIPEHLRGRYTAVLDFGTIEHIFDPPQVVRNISALLADNGTALIVTCGNGQCGHGFYQFSPEFFYSGFSAQNGFADTSVFLVDALRPKRWYSIPSPETQGKRSQTPYDRDLTIGCFTRKRRGAATVAVQQSDYANVEWAQEGHHHLAATKANPLLRFYKRAAPYSYSRTQFLFHAFKTKRGFSHQTTRFDPDREPLPAA